MAWLKLAIKALSDLQMVNELKTHPTVASAVQIRCCPRRYVDHTHADAVVAITNTADGEARIREIEVVIIPYVMPGFDLARLVAERFAAEATERTLGMVLMNQRHLFLRRHGPANPTSAWIALVGARGRDYLKAGNAWDLAFTAQPRYDDIDLAALRRDSPKPPAFLPARPRRRAQPRLRPRPTW